MSNSPDDQPGTQGQDDQPQGGHVQGGQPGQAGTPGQAGAPGQAGTPGQGGQPTGGQPPGGYQGGQPPEGGYDTGPGIGDILSIPETKNELKIGLVLNVLLSIGFALAAIGTSTLPFGGGFGVGTTAVGMTGAMAIAPLVGAILAVRQVEELEDQPDNILMGNAAVTGFAGGFVLMFLSFILSYLIAGGGGLGQVLVDVLIMQIIAAIGVAIVAVGTVWTLQNFVPGPDRTQPPQQQGPPR